jgi:hypothetical protein
MKKILAIAAALLLVLSLSVAVADDPIEINWADYSQMAASLNLGNNFVTLNNLALKVWMPDTFIEFPVDKDLADQGITSMYSTQDGEAGMIVALVEGKLNNVYDLPNVFADKNLQDQEFVTLNDFEAFSYTMAGKPEDQYIDFVSEEGSLIEFLFYPANDEKMGKVLQLMAASIQDAE